MYKLITFCVLCITQLLLATNYYVSTNINDNNAGTLTQPFKTIQKGIDVSQPGDMVYVKGSNYNQGSSGLYMAKKGSSGSPLDFISYPGKLAVIQFSCSGSPNTDWDWNCYKDYLDIGVVYHLSGLKLFFEGE